MRCLKGHHGTHKRSFVQKTLFSSQCVSETTPTAKNCGFQSLSSGWEPLAERNNVQLKTLRNSTFHLGLPSQTTLQTCVSVLLCLCVFSLNVRTPTVLSTGRNPFVCTRHTVTDTFNFELLWHDIVFHTSKKQTGFVVCFTEVSRTRRSVSFETLEQSALPQRSPSWRLLNTH